MVCRIVIASSVNEIFDRASILFPVGGKEFTKKTDVTNITAGARSTL